MSAAKGFGDMADDSENRNARKEPDVKQSFAWGQLFLGSILAGFSVYQLGLKAMSMPPSEMLTGFVATYHAVRDFLMLPFNWIELDLTASDKNALTAGLVLLGALMRAVVRYPNLLLPTAVVVLVVVSWTFPTSEHDGSLFGLTSWVDFTFRIILACSVLAPLTSVFIDPTEARQGNYFVLLNIAFSIACGAVLLLLNWATL